MVFRILSRGSRLFYCLLLAIACAASGPGVVGADQLPSEAEASTAIVPPLSYPLRASPNNRYLVDQTNTPALLVGDAPHSLFVNLTPAQAKFYFKNRAKYGINILWIEILCDAYTGGRADGSTYDGIVPFLTPGDFSTPNPRYFHRVDEMIQLAAQSGITVLLDTVDTGGWIGALDNSGPVKAHRYGRYLGNRYQNFRNIIWISGNDFQTWRTNSTDNRNVYEIMRGIAETDPNHLQTTQLNYWASGSLDDPLLSRYTTLAGAYTYYPTYAEVLKEYNAAHFRPTFMEEANYEFENNTGMDYGNAATLRRQEYWTMLSGATGQLYGNHYTWMFAPGWQSNLDTPGIVQLRYMKRFFARRAWWTLVPDQKHTVVTQGYGTFARSGSINANDYVTAAIAPSGGLALAYCPTSTTLTVDMQNMRGMTSARWFDPSNGTYTAIVGSPFANSGSRQFTTPGTNGDGDLDWVLVLQAA